MFFLFYSLHPRRGAQAWCLFLNSKIFSSAPLSEKVHPATATRTGGALATSLQVFLTLHRRVNFESVASLGPPLTARVAHWDTLAMVRQFARATKLSDKK
jgi:hypothetical protein